MARNHSRGVKTWWRRGDSNAGPRDHETLSRRFEELLDRLNLIDSEEDMLP
jgi:hypothetical protein